jgi:hypothetical protein
VFRLCDQEASSYTTVAKDCAILQYYHDRSLLVTVRIEPFDPRFKCAMTHFGCLVPLLHLIAEQHRPGSKSGGSENSWRKRPGGTE